MRTGISINVSASDHRRFEAIVSDRNAAQKHVWRARIILLTADDLGTQAIVAATGKSKTTVWRWQERFAEAGIAGLLRDKTRPPGKAPIPAGRTAEVVRRTQAPPPHEATHWTARAMAKPWGSVSRRCSASGPRTGSAPSLARLQAVEGPRLCRKAARHRGLVCCTACPCRGAQFR